MLAARSLRKADKRKKVKEAIAASKVAKKNKVEAMKANAAAVSSRPDDESNNAVVLEKKATKGATKGATTGATTGATKGAAKGSAMVDEPKTSAVEKPAATSDSESDSDSDSETDSDSGNGSESGSD
jgi:hypothetical protein